MKTKRNKMLLSIVIALVMTIITCIPIFATVTYYWEQWETIPNDIGTKVSSLGNTGDSTMVKGYIKITIPAQTNVVYTIGCYWYDYNASSESYINQNILIIQPSTGVIYNIGVNPVTRPLSTIQSLRIAPYYPGLDLTGTTFYLPVYLINARLVDNGISATGNNLIELYTSTNINVEQIEQEYYNLGYTNGYLTGYEDGFPDGLLEGQDIKQYTNLVGYVEQLIGQFTGDDVAQYITPLAIVLVILFVYFLFIRFLLSMIKAKGVIKTCDIIMIVGCIIILIVLYAPMLNLTIKTQNIDIEETTEVETIQRSNIRYWDVDEGDKIVHYGPVGTWVEYKETVNIIDKEEIYKIETDVNVKEYVTREQNN